jgi:hypothetical protein
MNSNSSILITPVKPPPDLRLTRIQVEDFRCIESLDIEIPENVKVICFVGSNGSSKTALLSMLFDSLCDGTQLQTPDLGQNESQQNNPYLWKRQKFTGEVRHGRPAYFLLATWKMDAQFSQWLDIVVNSTNPLNVSKHFPQISSTVDVPTKIDLFFRKWYAKPHSDPVSRSVLLYRPADRSERPSFEELESEEVTISLRTRTYNQRPFPVRVKTLGLQLEKIIADLLIDQLAGDSSAANILNSIRLFWQDLTGQKAVINVNQSPFRRIGFDGLHRFSMLSSGELDILSTAICIFSQQRYLRITSEMTDWPQAGPSGFVFIDEVDAHMHPKWQTEVLPLFLRHFPSITFIITTHSPFVVQSLPRSTSCVIRLPDGEVFDTDFEAWRIEDISESVFQTSGNWVKGFADKLRRLTELCKNPAEAHSALELFNEMKSRNSSPLNSACDRIAAIHGSEAFVDLLKETQK